MSQPPSRLNPSAFSFVPGQVQVPRQNPQQGYPQQQGQPGEQSIPGTGGQQYSIGGSATQGYPPYGGYPQGQYGQYGPPPGQGGYGGPPYGGYTPPQQRAYTPPHLRQQPLQQSQQPPDSLPSRPPYAPPQSDRVPIEREQPAQAPAVPTINPHIGGKPTLENAGVDPAPAKTIKLNIGASKEKEKPPAAPAAAPATTSAKPTATPSIPKLAPASAPESGHSSTTATGININAPVSKSTKDFNFTSDKSKTTAEAVLNDAIAAADQETLKDLYGDGEVIDPNGIVEMRISSNLSG